MNIPEIVPNKISGLFFINIILQKDRKNPRITKNFIQNLCKDNLKHSPIGLLKKLNTGTSGKI